MTSPRGEDATHAARRAGYQKVSSVGKISHLSGEEASLSGQSADVVGDCEERSAAVKSILPMCALVRVVLGSLSVSDFSLGAFLLQSIKNTLTVVPLK
jgi:hypothetical protein